MSNSDSSSNKSKGFIHSQTAAALIKGLFGIIMIILAYWLGMRSSQTLAPPLSCGQYGIAITKPSNGYIVVGGKVRIEGTFKELPPYDSAHVLIAGDTYWHQGQLSFDASARTWEQDIYTSSDVDVIVVLAGEPGRILMGFFKIARDVAVSQGAEYTGLPQLTSDIIECDRVSVKVQN